MTSATRHGISAAAASSASRDGVADACRDAVEALGSDVGLLLAFLSGDFDFDSSAAAMQCSAGDGVPTAGLSGRGLITADGPLDEGCVAVAFGSQLRAAVASAHGAGADLRTAGRSSTREALDSLGGEADIVLLFIDATTGDLADAVSGAYAEAGPGIPLAGGAAGGSEKHFLHMGTASSDTVVAVAIRSEGALAVGETQTCKTKGVPSIVTRSTGQRIDEIDGRPAEEVYLEQLGFAGTSFDEEEFEVFSITHPLAQPELHGDIRLRHVVGKSGDGAILCGTHIPVGAAIEFTELEFDELLESGGRSVADGIEGLGGDGAAAALVFDCAGRRRALQDGLDQEVDAIIAAAGQSVPLAGLYTSGEVARLQGAKGDRNHAVITVAFG